MCRGMLESDPCKRLSSDETTHCADKTMQSHWFVFPLFLCAVCLCVCVCVCCCVVCSSHCIVCVDKVFRPVFSDLVDTCAHECTAEGDGVTKQSTFVFLCCFVVCFRSHVCVCTVSIALETTGGLSPRATTLSVVPSLSAVSGFPVQTQQTQAAHVARITITARDRLGQRMRGGDRFVCEFKTPQIQTHTIHAQECECE